ncbi:MAG: response regulator transcription factor [Lentisphaerae bacterium]|jgi:DNA-binding response OmpR family regulator|nr:response regulator transcription factor [Lentisphaerota bacterium]MBT4816362.1 response regulator transcription factor [Lentisphaerota bacterium]MBT5609351.1 response regulator transcription factor [Lentisphaerota bacterium]MBT7058536.1 response regulator transcription factor [Lentisphaerota bacterium]MBT7841092.1 response regulator transcription factor [Lentisphaerota bacterium]
MPQEAQDTGTARIAIVEDEADMARVLEFNLKQRGHDAVILETCSAALNAIPTAPPDLVLLDVRLPDGSGLDVLQQLRGDKRTADVPVIIVSAMGDEETVVDGLNRGADDYVTKPFRVHELMARVSAALRRRTGVAVEAASLVCGDISLVPDRREVVAGGSDVSLTRSEFDLLAHFVANPDRVFTRQQLCHQALGAGNAVQERTIDAHIRTIRKKLGEPGKRLATVWGIGYKLVESPADSTAE